MVIWSNGFREDFFLIGKSQTRTAYGGHIRMFMKYGNFVQDFPHIIPTK